MKITGLKFIRLKFKKKSIHYIVIPEVKVDWQEKEMFSQFAWHSEVQRGIIFLTVIEYHSYNVLANRNKVDRK